MSVRRVMGTETEYAVSRRGADRYNPVRLSFDVVAAAADPSTSHIRWDYRGEDPVNDARGHRLPRAAARPDMLTDEPQLQIVNVIAPNGGRVYVDHAHPEYSSPETTDPFDAVRYDHAGDLIMAEAARRASTADAVIELHRNNVDGKGASWGTHENYMMDRAVPFERVTALMTAHLVSRQIYAGSGRVGLGERGEQAGFQLSQRADYIHMRVGLQTTFDRPIINTRDESHSTADHRRLHVIVGDANRMDVPQLLKLGTTSMILWLLEHLDESGTDFDSLMDGLMLADPVEALHTVSRDLTLSAPLALESGRCTDAWNMQVRLRGAVYELAAALYGTDNRGEPLWPDKSTARVMAMWGQALADVAAMRHAGDDARLTMRDEASRIEWLLKWQLMERYRRKRHAGGSSAGAADARSGMAGVAAGWDDPRLAALDLAWAVLDPGTSLTERLSASITHLDGRERVEQAATEPPSDTRAWLRAMLVRRYPEQTVAASWSQLTVRDASLPSGLRTLDCTDPLAYNRDRCEQAVEESCDAAGLFGALCADAGNTR
ncbi:depupylase/deamidase Dop [uncultured Bifidobacterium sp.]|uniref:depupylase/deamidase Dop n=1 Tax=uncultured Bifidobacterium sp. TaxID=165187 RepID=UPI002582AC41|nr:depupylase/deamidase Dop [uncultured Bifidobacterium sp.]